MTLSDEPSNSGDNADPAAVLLSSARAPVAQFCPLAFEAKLRAASLEDLRHAYIRAAGAGGHGPVAELLAWPLLLRLEAQGPTQEAVALRAGIADHCRRVHALDAAPFGLVRELAWRTNAHRDRPKATPPADRATASGDLDLALQAVRILLRVDLRQALGASSFNLAHALEAAGRPEAAIELYRVLHDAEHVLMENPNLAFKARTGLGLSRSHGALGQSEEADRYLQEARQHLHEAIEERRQEDPFGFCNGVLVDDLHEVLTEAGQPTDAAALAHEVLALLEAAEAGGFRDPASGFHPQHAPGVAEDIAELRAWLARHGV